MTREEKCKLAIEMGYKYEPETGEIFGIRGKKINTKYKEGYIYMNNSKFQLRGHQFAWYWVHKECTEEIDHINGVKDDNRIINLRSVTHQQNMWNRKNDKGYWFRKDTQKYQAKIQVNGKIKCIGHFNTEQEAHQAYLNAKEKYHII
jgi:hypothetical protein